MNWEVLVVDMLTSERTWGTKRNPSPSQHFHNWQATRISYTTSTQNPLTDFSAQMTDAQCLVACQSPSLLTQTGVTATLQGAINMMQAMKDVVDFIERHYDLFRHTLPGSPRSSFQFLVLGSYPAHIRMVQMGLQTAIRYNDIDIFHKDQDFARYIAGKPSKHLSTERGRKELKAVQYVPFRTNMDINYACLSTAADLKARVADADINGVAIGVLVTLNFSNMRSEGLVIESAAFKEFLQTQALAICDFRSLVKPRNALTSLVRLLHKGQQSNPMVVQPPDTDIVDMCHGRAIGPEHV